MKLSHFLIKKSTTKLAMVIFTAATLVACKKTNPVPKQEPIKPIADFTFTFDENDPKSVSFQNTSKDAVSFSWDFGDKTAASTTKDPKHTYATVGTYEVTLIVSSSTNTKDTLTKTVKPEYPKPAVPKFTIQVADKDHPGDPSVITFQNTSAVEDGVLYQWNFGDGDVLQDNSRNAVNHKYKASGKYQVTLTAMNNHGTVAKIDTVKAFVFKNIKIETVVLDSMPKLGPGAFDYDPFGNAPDPYFIISIPNDKIDNAFESATIDNSFLGEWAIDFTFGIAQSIRLNFFDNDKPLSPDKIGDVDCADGQSMLNKYPNKSFRFAKRTFPGYRQGVLSVNLIVTYMP